MQQGKRKGGKKVHLKAGKSVRKVHETGNQRRNLQHKENKVEKKCTKRIDIESKEWRERKRERKTQ